MSKTAGIRPMAKASRVETMLIYSVSPIAGKSILENISGNLEKSIPNIKQPPTKRHFA